MGDRGNIKVVDGKSTVYLYTHWNGSDLPSIVREIMQTAPARHRYLDGPYLTRILFCGLIERGGGDFAGELGYGITAQFNHIDGHDQVLIVNIDKQTVQWNRGAAETFADFIQPHEPTE